MAISILRPDAGSSLVIDGVRSGFELVFNDLDGGGVLDIDVF